MADLWERQQGETSKAFGAFTAYRDMPASERSLSKVAQMLSISRGTLLRWSARFSWVSRVEAWDDEQDRHKRAAQTKAIESMAERHAATAQLALQAVSTPISVYLRRLRAMQQRPEDDPERMDFELQTMDVDALFRLMFRAAGVMPQLVDMERKSRGQPTDVHAIARPTVALESLTEDERFNRVSQIAEILKATGVFEMIAGGGQEELAEVVLSEDELA